MNVSVLMIDLSSMVSWWIACSDWFYVVVERGGLEGDRVAMIIRELPPCQYRAMVIHQSRFSIGAYLCVCVYDEQKKSVIRPDSVTPIARFLRGVRECALEEHT